MNDAGLSRRLSDRTLRVGVIGCGYMGRAHVKALLDASGSLGVSIDPAGSFLADTDSSAAGRLSCLTGWRTLTPEDRRPEIDLLVISTPPSTHVTIAETWLPVAGKVLIEKPIAANLTDAIRLEAYSPRIALGLSQRFLPYVDHARRLTAMKHCGDLISFSASYLTDQAGRGEQSWRFSSGEGPGVLSDLGTHVFDTMRYVTGLEFSVAGAASSTIQAEHSDLSTNEDVASLVLMAGNGACGTIDLSRTARGFDRPHQHVSLHYTINTLSMCRRDLGRLVISDRAGSRAVTVPTLTGPHEPAVQGDLLPTWTGQFEAQMADVLAWVLLDERSERLGTVADGIASLRLARQAADRGVARTGDPT